MIPSRNTGLQSPQKLRERQPVKLSGICITIHFFDEYCEASRYAKEGIAIIKKPHEFRIGEAVKDSAPVFP
jgi:hypothetical protein